MAPFENERLKERQPQGVEIAKKLVNISEKNSYYKKLIEEVQNLKEKLNFKSEF